MAVRIKTSFLRSEIEKPLLAANIIMAAIYFAVILLLFPRGNVFLFWALVVGEIFHVWQLISYCFTVWDTKFKALYDSEFKPPADVFITVCGEPVEVVEETAKAALKMNYPEFKVYILNDGFVGNKENWHEIEIMAGKIGVHCVTRTKAGGAKSGNINNALSTTNNPFIAMFDADHVPHKDFLEKTVGYFVDESLAFVQTPQFYKNYRKNEITAAAWEQQSLFFGAISEGKNRLNSMFMCGTNLVIRRKAIEDVGGFAEDNIAEDFITSLFIHEKGWKSLYVQEVLAEGLAPEDFVSYYKQQYRWARGSLEVVFKQNPIFNRKLTWSQKMQYLSSASYFLTGPVVLMNALLPVVFFFTGATPFLIPTMLLATVFLPYIFLTIYILLRSSNYTFTFRAVSFSVSSFVIHLRAIFATLFGLKSSFSVTSKKQLTGNFVGLVVPNLLYIFSAIAGLAVALHREGLSASVASNASWALFNVVLFVPFISAALPKPVPVRRKVAVAVNAVAEETAIINVKKI